MIRLKSIIIEEGMGDGGLLTLSSKDIYNFYVLWNLYLTSPELINTQYGKNVLTFYLGKFKKQYVTIFSKLLANQIRKYIVRKRIDVDFPINVDLDKLAIELNTKELGQLMRKTFRSDMVRRNDVWNLVGDFVYNLSNSSNTKDTFIWIDRLNNTVHNTGGAVLDKLNNYYGELNRAFDNCHNAKNILNLMQYVDSDIRKLKDQDVYGDSHEELSEGLINYLRKNCNIL